MKKRKSGYYWVKHNGEHHIAWYDNMEHPFKSGIIGYWHYCCHNGVLMDDDFDWISKKLLVGPSGR